MSGDVVLYNHRREHTNTDRKENIMKLTGYLLNLADMDGVV